jgi:hypothetical protein
MSASTPDRDSDVGAGRRSSTGTPRWVKVFGVVALVLVLIVIVGLVTRTGWAWWTRAGPAHAAW